MKIVFRWAREELPGTSWLTLFRRAWPAYRRWFQSEGDGQRPDLDTCRQALRAHMPELLPVWERLIALAGGNEEVARMLSLYCPPPYLTGCTQAVWTDGAPFLVRNYDYHPAACEGLFLSSKWRGTEVLAASDCLWGALDGMNEHGLAAALSFGGSRQVGLGFGIPLILRYVLEICSTLDEAVEVLTAVPSHMAYNVMVLDRSGDFGVVHVHPDRPTQLIREPIATNHQDRIEWREYVDRTHSRERKAFMMGKMKAEGGGREGVLDLFLRPPIHVTDYAGGQGTLYTVAYHPEEASVDYAWPGYRTRKSLDEFTPSEIVIPY